MVNRLLPIFALLMLCTLSAQVQMLRQHSPANTVLFFDLHDVVLKPDTRKRLKISLKNPIGALKLAARVATNKNWANGEQLQVELRRKGDTKQAEMVRQLSAAYKIDKDVFQILQELKAKGYTLCMASNIGAGNLNDLLDERHSRNKAKNSITLRDVFALFDDLVFVDYESQDVICKPDPRYFALLHDRCGHNKNIVFVDDNKKNVAAAHTCGIQSICFTSASKLATDLKTLGII